MVSEPEWELSGEFSTDNFGSIDTTRLANSNVVQNLDAKLSHLSGSQCQDLEKLLQELKHLFPDVCCRADQIYHDVDVSD